MVDDSRFSIGLFGLLAVGVGACCVIPVLAVVGAFGAFAGLSLGSGFLMVAGMAVGGFGVYLWRRRSGAECALPAEVSEAGRS